MSDRRRATQFEDLPEEIIVDQILIRLLSKDVGRYRAVNTSWHHATSTPQFMLEHRRRQPLLPIIDGQRKPSSYAVYTGAGASGQQLWPFLPGSKTRYNALFASCDGLLIVNYGPRLYICNPVIRRHALLPLLVYGQGFVNIVIGFYRHHPTKDYRVRLVSQNYPKYSLHNLTVGSDESRHIKVTMPAVSLPSVEQKLLNRLTNLHHCPPAV
jgi:hypothetical protein